MSTSGDLPPAIANAITLMALDRLAVKISHQLVTASVPHVIIKGFTTSWWLYDPPRPYSDVDVLVPRSFVKAAAETLERADVAHRRNGRVGEMAHHSLLLTTPAGAEVDLHVLLPMMAFECTSEALFGRLASHVTPFEIDGSSVPALDDVGRALVLGLHALGSRATDSQPAEDLRRAVSRLRDRWEEVEVLADDLGVRDLLRGGLVVAHNQDSSSLDPGVREWLAGRPTRFFLARLRSAPRRAAVDYLLREIFPSADFIRATEMDSLTRIGLPRAYIRRWLRIARELSG